MYHIVVALNLAAHIVNDNILFGVSQEGHYKLEGRAENVYILDMRLSICKCTVCVCVSVNRCQFEACIWMLHNIDSKKLVSMRT